MIGSTHGSNFNEDENACRFDLQFIQRNVIRESYFRNNRACGQKNIRCFPTCGPKHVSKHFCGRSILVKLRCVTPLDSSNNKPINWKEIRLIGEFNSEEDIQNGVADSSLRFLPPTISAESECLNSCKFLGTILYVSKDVVIDDCLVSACVAEFNQENRGYNYLWTGSRFTTDSKHTFSVSLYLPIQTDHRIEGFEKHSSFRTAMFTIDSLRRRGDKLLEDACTATKQSDSELFYQPDDSEDVDFGFAEFYKGCADLHRTLCPTQPKRRHPARATAVKAKRTKQSASIPTPSITGIGSFDIIFAANPLLSPTNYPTVSSGTTSTATSASCWRGCSDVLEPI